MILRLELLVSLVTELMKRGKVGGFGALLHGFFTSPGHTALGEYRCDI